ncbi:MAG: hypothetical protein B6D41_13935, partial [Chloroflexi bacterium UTCFX4]
MTETLIPENKITIGGFTIPDPPHDADLLRCVHCGLCLNHCPTYRLTSLETESPRGRIFLIKELAEGKQIVNDIFTEHIGLCLDCRNCETVCPSGVRYGVLLEAARGEIVKQGKLSRQEKFIRWAVFKQLFPHPARLNFVVGMAGLYQRTLQPIVRASGILKLFGRLGEMEGMLPARKLRQYKPPKPKSPPPEIEGAYRRTESPVSSLQSPKRRVALFTGCLMRAGFANIHEATVRVLEKNHYEVIIPDGQICCAALHVHAGERDIAREMAKHNIDLFMRDQWDAIVINAAGCGAQLKEYAEIFRDDPEYFHKAEEFAKRVKDVSELLAPTLAPNASLQNKTRVTYQDACHLAHAQKIRLQPRQILKQIGNVELVEMRASDRCCGSAGIYNVVHPEMSDQLIDEKMVNTRDTRAEIVVTGNIGCLLQLEYGARRARWNGRVLH